MKNARGALTGGVQVNVDKNQLSAEMHWINTVEMPRVRRI
jgi:hypothetical protein